MECLDFLKEYHTCIFLCELLFEGTRLKDFLGKNRNADYVLRVPGGNPVNGLPPARHLSLGKARGVILVPR